MGPSFLSQGAPWAWDMSEDPGQPAGGLFSHSEKILLKFYSGTIRNAATTMVNFLLRQGHYYFPNVWMWVSEANSLNI